MARVDWIRRRTIEDRRARRRAVVAWVRAGRPAVRYVRGDGVPELGAFSTLRRWRRVSWATWRRARLWSMRRAPCVELN